MWTRRRFALASLATGAAALAPGLANAATASPFALGPSYAPAWAPHRADPAPRLVQLPDGVRLRAGPALPGPGDRGGLALWSRAAWAAAAGLEASFTTTKRDASVAVGPPLFLSVYLGARGDGSPGHPASLAAWPAGTLPYGHAYADHVVGARLALYRQSVAANGETAAAELALLRADGSITLVPPASPVAFPGRRGVAYAWTLTRRGATLAVAQTTGVARRTATFAHPALATLAGGLGLLVSPGRDVEVRAFAAGVPR